MIAYNINDDINIKLMLSKINEIHILIDKLNYDLSQIELFNDLHYNY